MISALSWVPKGASKPVPTQVNPPSMEEIEDIMKMGALNRSGDIGSEDDDDMDADTTMQSDVSHALAVAESLGKATKKKSMTPKLGGGLEELDLEHYDEEEDGIELFSTGLGDLYYPSNEMDPYLKDNFDYDSEEVEDMTITSKDAVIVCARNEDDLSNLEVWILEECGDDCINLYPHHAIILPAFPLCTAWLDFPFKEGDKGNFIAIGSMEPAIEIWDLNLIDEVLPSMVLGGIVEKKKGKKRATKYKEGSHTDSVLSLAWNKQVRNIIASGSADNQVKIWDMAVEKCVITMSHHTDKVQAVAWNHHQLDVLLSGSFDKSVVMKDAKSPHPGIKWPVMADVESLMWNPHNNYSFVVSLEDGTVHGIDIRMASLDSTQNNKHSFTLHAHNKAVCTVSYNPSAPDLLATGSMDKSVKLWDLSNNEPSCIASQNPKGGAVFFISFSGDIPHFLAIGGSKGKLHVWNILSEDEVSRRFGKKLH